MNEFGKGARISPLYLSQPQLEYLQRYTMTSKFVWWTLSFTLFHCVISCCSTEVFLEIAICPTCISSVLETGNVLCNNRRCTQTGRISSCAHTARILNCWTAPPTFPCSHLPSWTTAPCEHWSITTWNTSHPNKHTLRLKTRRIETHTLNLCFSKSDMMNCAMSADTM